MLGGLIGAGASLLGGVLDRNAANKSAKRAAKAVLPYNINTAGGDVSIDQKSRAVTANLSPEQQALYNMLGQQGMGMLGGGGPYGGFQQFSQFLGNQAMPGMFNDYLNASGQIPNQAFSHFGGLMGGMGNMALGGAQQGLDAAFAPGMNQGLSAQLFGQGMGMQNQNVDQYRDIAANQLDLMRQQSAPQEERAANSMMQSLFSKGQMAGTGGARNMEAFAQGLSNADMQRQLSSQQFAEGLYRGDQQFAQNQARLGQGLIGMGFQGQGMDQNYQNMMGSLGQGLLGQAGGFANQGLNASIGQSEMVNSRATQRLGEAQRMLFGGAELGNQNQQNALNLFGQQGNLQSMLYNLMGMSSNMGSGQASGAQAMSRMLPTTSPFSGAIDRVGGAMMNHFLPGAASTGQGAAAAPGGFGF